MRPSLPAGSRSDNDRGLSARIVLGRAVVSESADYFVLLGITLFLLAFGLLMVLSSSSLESMAAGGTFFA
ncbi:MAG: cell division protein FtsW, partial [Naasia sp.]